MGCSSGSLKKVGIYEPDSIFVNYLIGGCPTIVANLWDVTSQDMEQFTSCLLENWTSPALPSLNRALCEARSKAQIKFRNLNGDAPVCYGLPVQARNANFFAKQNATIAKQPPQKRVTSSPGVLLQRDESQRNEETFKNQLQNESNETPKSIVVVKSEAENEKSQKVTKAMAAVKNEGENEQGQKVKKSMNTVKNEGENEVNHKTTKSKSTKAVKNIYEPSAQSTMSEPTTTLRRSTRIKTATKN